MGGEEARADVLLNLAAWLPERTLGRALELALEINDEELRADVLGTLAERLPARLVDQALQATQAITLQEKQAWILHGLTNWLPEHRFEDVLQMTRSITSDKDRAWVLRRLAGRLMDAGEVGLYRFWTDLLADAATRNRSHLFASGISSLIPPLGGANAAKAKPGTGSSAYSAGGHTQSSHNPGDCQRDDPFGQAGRRRRGSA